jgi:predicted hydrolase (HD superfamily)
MELAEARALVREKTDKDITVRHLISVEGVMRALARRLGEDEHRCALAGLFHDLGWRAAPARPHLAWGPPVLAQRLVGLEAWACS